MGDASAEDMKCTSFVPIAAVADPIAAAAAVVAPPLDRC